MAVVATLLVVVVAAIHVYIVVLEFSAPSQERATRSWRPDHQGAAR